MLETVSIVVAPGPVLPLAACPQPQQHVVPAPGAVIVSHTGAGPLGAEPENLRVVERMSPCPGVIKIG